MHDVERLTWDCLSRVVQLADPDRTGWAIDAGLGHGDFYCEWFHTLGYPVIAVEPLPAPEAIRACEVSHIPLYLAALGGQDGSAPLFEAPERDLRSLAGALWGDMTPIREIEVISLPTLLARHGITRLTALKLDIEGAEPDVLVSLSALEPDARPLVLCFEWGGEHPALTKRGPWQAAHLAKVQRTFKLLRRLGYHTGALIGAGSHLFSRSWTAAVPIWQPGDNWGNAILTRAPLAPAAFQEAWV